MSQGFEGFDPSQLDMNALLAQAQQMQAQLQQAQAELQNTTFVGSAGGGLVEATLQGSGELVGLKIDPQAIDPADTESLADLIIAAVRDAGTKLNAHAHAVLPQLPPMGF